MKTLALATDYDGTLAEHGAVDDATVDALRRFRDSGRKLVMVTGRELDELKTVCQCLDLFDLVVAENGALIYHPDTGVERKLGESPTPEFVERLVKLNVPVSVGRVIVATWVGHEHHVLEAIHDLGLGWQVIFNKNAVMALPPGIDKASGLREATAELGLTLEGTIGVGDAENDLAFMAVCGLSAAVDNAIDAVKEHATVRLARPRGAGVTELIDRVLAGEFDRA